jgi:hypothetical protein
MSPAAPITTAADKRQGQHDRRQTQQKIIHSEGLAMDAGSIPALAETNSKK